MPGYRPGQVADLLGVSADTVRRWADSGRLKTRRTAGGQREVEGVDLAEFLKSSGDTSPLPPVVGASARNRFAGIVTEVVVDKVAAKVEMQAGPHRIVALMTAEAVEDLGLEPGVLAVASVKSTNVVIELAEGP
jgi:molybdopterin-binding protein